jgi:RNA polymerase sigma factor (TIGR02999 family)
MLEQVRAGDREAADALFEVVYGELHGLAERQRRAWHGDYTLNATALVHEAYLKLVDHEHLDANNRAHFFALAARAMRHILINYAKAQRRQKRGGDVPKVSLEDAPLRALEDQLILSSERADQLVLLETALTHLERHSPRQSRVVECRFFGGMSVPETAAALDLSPATIKRDWSVARAWLFREMQRLQEPLA